MLVGGDWVGARSGAVFDTINPYTGVPWAQVPDGDAADVDAAVAAARDALVGPWGAMTGTQRARVMRSLAALVAERASELARLETTDNGKLLREMQGQMEYLPEWLYYFAGLADKLEGRAVPSDRPNFFAYTREEPVGVVAAITPWNSPLLLLMWKLAPALAAGCTMVVKPSDYTPVSTLAFAQLCLDAGLPPGVVNVVTGNGPAVGEALVAHPGVDMVAFTGSERVGALVGSAAMKHLARPLLELGGKSAQIVFPDAALDAAVNGVVAGIFAATGQTCIAGSRLLVHEDVHDELLELLVRRAQTIVLGDPMEAATEMGPLANATQLETVRGFISAATDEGARIATGGGSPPQGGYFVQPTIVTGVTNDMAIAREEIFGPVLAVQTFSTEDEAVALANDSRYGLAAGVWTLNVHRAHRVAHRIKAGTVWVNSYRLVAPNAPFGGVKSSGVGRENGADAVREFTETKCIWIELDGATRDPFKLG
jgi:aldehyde dehydrogenase (NAD+)